MDPKANIQEQLQLAKDIIAREDSGEEMSRDDTVRLAELVFALHAWRAAGGFDPYVRNGVLTRWDDV